MYKQEKKYYLRAFLYALIMAAAAMLPIVIMDGGIMSYYGDFNMQQIPFYQTCIRNLHSGNFGWDWCVDLGVNTIGSFSFYTLGSPFFWLAALFPASFAPFLMAPLMALKIALSSLFAFVYIRRFVKNPQTAVIGGILYAFSGFSVQNIFFNHFHEAICFFPLLLIALEEAVVNKRRGVFVLAVALNALVNYFFFYGECVFLVIYFIVRLCMDKRFRISLGDFFSLAFESIAGVAAAGVLLIPAIYQTMALNRVSSILTDWDFLFFLNHPQRYGLLVESMLCLPEGTARSFMFPSSEARWSSVSLYIPLFGLAGVIAFFKSRKKHWVKLLLILCLIFAFIPGLNAMFTMFNSQYYTRWFYMPTLIMCMATVYALERTDVDMKFGLKASAIATLSFILMVELSPFAITLETFDENRQIVENTIYKPRILYSGMNLPLFIMLAVSVLSLPLLAKLLKNRDILSREKFLKRASAFVVALCMVNICYTLYFGRSMGFEAGKYLEDLNRKVDFNDDDFFRIDTDHMVNRNFSLGYGSPRSFISIVPPATEAIHEKFIDTRVVNSKVQPDDFGFRAMTCCKYYLVYSPLEKVFDSNSALERFLDSHTFVGENNGIQVYRNEYALPMGWSYDYYATDQQFEALNKWCSGEYDRIYNDLAENGIPITSADYEPLYLSYLPIRAAMLAQEDIEKYSDILEQLPDEELYNLSYEQFKLDAKERIADGIVDFEANGSRFTAKTNYDTERLVVLSVPHDEGWSATIGGEPVELDTVNAGFIGLRVPAGEQTIEFRYTCKGLKEGTVLTLCALAAIALYLLLEYCVLKRRPMKYVHFYGEEMHEGVSLHESYLLRLSKSSFGKKNDKDDNN